MHHLFFLGISRVLRFGAHPEFAEVKALDEGGCLTAYVSQLCKAVSSCKSSGPNVAALFDLD